MGSSRGLFDDAGSKAVGQGISNHIGNADPWEYDSPGNPSEVHVHVDDGFVEETARFDIKWTMKDEYNINYKEPGKPGEPTGFQYRFDKHQEPTVPDRHFHPAPDAGAPVNSCIRTVIQRRVGMAVADSYNVAIQNNDHNLLNTLSNPP